MDLIYIDESGDHSPLASNPEYPVLVLVACVFDSKNYADEFLPKLTHLKIKHVGHDVVVLHEREIRRPSGPFKFLINPQSRKRFLDDLSEWVRRSGARVYGLAWDKRVNHPKTVSYGYCLLELLKQLLEDIDKKDLPRPVIIESRGRNEDKEVAELLAGHREYWVPIFANKSSNVGGLQLADMCARPIGVKVLRPSGINRAYDECVKPLIVPASRGSHSDIGIRLI